MCGVATTYRTIDTLEDRHLPELMRLYADAWWSRERTVEQVRDLLRWSDLVVGLCAPPDDRLVAFARVLTDRTFRAMMYDVIVDANMRGRGLGHRLMQAVVSHPMLQGVEYVELYCRPELAPFYRSLGFTSPGSGVILMRRSAADPG